MLCEPPAGSRRVRRGLPPRRPRPERGRGGADPAGDLPPAAATGGPARLELGTLTFDQVRVDPADLLGRPGTAAALCAEHFAAFRPLVTATALGGAAAVVDEVLARLDQRLDLGWIRAPRDSALSTLGRHAAAIHAGLLACLAAVGLAAAGDPAAATWGLLVKAHSVDAACRAAAEVGLLAGALGYQAGHRIDKTRRDLDGLRYADGIHEELYRAAGRAILTDTRASSRAHLVAGLAAPTIDDLIAAEP